MDHKEFCPQSDAIHVADPWSKRVESLASLEYPSADLLVKLTVITHCSSKVTEVVHNSAPFLT